MAKAFLLFLLIPTIGMADPDYIKPPAENENDNYSSEEFFFGMGLTLSEWMGSLIELEIPLKKGFTLCGLVDFMGFLNQAGYGIAIRKYLFRRKIFFELAQVYHPRGKGDLYKNGRRYPIAYDSYAFLKTSIYYIYNKGNYRLLGGIGYRFFVDHIQWKSEGTLPKDEIDAILHNPIQITVILSFLL